jgi:hypothetical protein
VSSRVPRWWYLTVTCVINNGAGVGSSKHSPYEPQSRPLHLVNRRRQVQDPGPFMYEYSSVSWDHIENTAAAVTGNTAQGPGKLDVVLVIIRRRSNTVRT